MGSLELLKYRISAWYRLEDNIYLGSRLENLPTNGSLVMGQN